MQSRWKRLQCQLIPFRIGSRVENANPDQGVGVARLRPAFLVSGYPSRFFDCVVYFFGQEPRTPMMQTEKLEPWTVNEGKEGFDIFLSGAASPLLNSREMLFLKSIVRRKVQTQKPQRGSIFFLQVPAGWDVRPHGWWVWLDPRAPQPQLVRRRRCNASTVEARNNWAHRRSGGEGRVRVGREQFATVSQAGPHQKRPRRKDGRDMQLTHTHLLVAGCASLPRTASAKTL